MATSTWLPRQRLIVRRLPPAGEGTFAVNVAEIYARLMREYVEDWDRRRGIITTITPAVRPADALQVIAWWMINQPGAVDGISEQQMIASICNGTRDRYGQTVEEFAARPRGLLIGPRGYIY
jgi:hypothetical protein